MKPVHWSARHVRGAEAAAESIEPPDDEHVALTQRSASLRPPSAADGHAAGMFLEQALTAGIGEGFALMLKVLVDSANECADDHDRRFENSVSMGLRNTVFRTASATSDRSVMVAGDEPAAGVP